MDALLTLRNMEDIKISNNTKIQYLLVADTIIYRVTNIDFHNLSIEAARTDLSIADVPESEIFPIEDFGDYRIRLINGDDDNGGRGEVSGDVICFGEWIRTHNV